MHKNSSKTPPSTLRRNLIGLSAGLGTLICAGGLSSCSLIGSKKPVVGLVLGAGAARGFAHVGAIKALEAQGIRPDIVVSSSAGSIIAALLASGTTGSDLNRLPLILMKPRLQTGDCYLLDALVALLKAMLSKTW